MWVGLGWVEWNLISFWLKNLSKENGANRLNHVQWAFQQLFLALPPRQPRLPAGCLLACSFRRLRNLHARIQARGSARGDQGQQESRKVGALHSGLFPQQETNFFQISPAAAPVCREKIELLGADSQGEGVGRQTPAEEGASPAHDRKDPDCRGGSAFQVWGRGQSCDQAKQEKEE